MRREGEESVPLKRTGPRERGECGEASLPEEEVRGGWTLCYVIECNAVDSGDGEQGTERSQVVGRRGGGRGRGVGVGVRGRGREGERRDPRSGSDREQRRNKPPSSGEDGPVLRKYEEPQQPVSHTHSHTNTVSFLIYLQTFSQPSRYAMLEMEGDEAVPSAKDHQPQAKNN